VAKAAAAVCGKEAEIIHYEPKDYTFPEGKKVSNTTLFVEFLRHRCD
jgi:hypothetical protein